MDSQFGNHCTKLKLLSSFYFDGKLCVLRDAVEEQAFSRLLKVLTRLSSELQAANGDDADMQSVALQLQLIAECFRAQRNSCVQSTRNQSLLR